MGNCLIRNNQVSAHDDYDYDYGDNYVDKKPCKSEVDHQLKKKEDVEEPANIKMPEESMKKEKKKIKKKVRFELEKDDEKQEGREEIGGGRRSGSVRIKLVVTQEELRRILMSHENGTQQQKTTLEQLLNSVRCRGSRRRICEVIGEDIDNGAINNGWRPTLESIPEDLIQ